MLQYWKIIFQYNNNNNNNNACVESSQHSRSQTRTKEEGCVRFGEPAEKSATLMEMKHIRKIIFQYWKKNFILHY